MEQSTGYTKWLAIGIISLFVSISFAPSINAIATQRININRTTENKIGSQSVSILFKRLHKLVKEGEWIKHPLLFIIVLMLPMFRSIRALLLLMISMKFSGHHKNPDWYVWGDHPLLIFRAFWLLSTVAYWYAFWQYVSDTQGWNWPLNKIG
jgi:hypothetical protein